VENNKMVLYGPDQTREFVVQTSRDTLNFFPSVNLTFSLNEKNLIRLAYGKTINRPEFREVAPFAFYNFKENVTVYGNPNIKSCYINNYDIRYEWYPGTGEMITIGGFYKEFDSPIEATWIPASGGEWDLRYLNAINGTSFGIEIDIRKGFQGLAKQHNFLKYFRNFSLVLNAAYIRSRVETNPEYLFVLDNKRPMFGQSPYIVNAGLYYQGEKNGLSVSLLYNVFGQRIVGVGTPDIPNSYEMPRNILDLTLLKRIGKNMVVKFGVKDILNQDVLVQQTMKAEGLPDVKIRVKAYKPGRLFSFGITYTI
jgi:outer membrane receptor protein involved in Fe transport